MPIKYPRRAGMLLKTRQATTYHVGDDGDFETGVPAAYSILTTGQYSGTTTVDTPHYADNNISFILPNNIHALAGLDTFFDGDTIVVNGSASNDGVYVIDVLGGGSATDIFVVGLGIVNEAAGAYITISKRSTPSNECVLDNVTGRMWRRYSTSRLGAPEQTGLSDPPASSNGSLNWYDDTTPFVYTLHPVGADLQMMVTGIKIIGGAAEIDRYFAGMIVVCSGFANPENNLPGYRITSVAVNGADLDILLWTGNNTLIAEAAAGTRNIRVICCSIFAYVAGANAAGQAGHSDWRVPNRTEYLSLAETESPGGSPNAVAFPDFEVGQNYWASGSDPSFPADGNYISFFAAAVGTMTKVNRVSLYLVRG